MDYKNNKRWSPEDVKQYDGLKSYYQMIEPEYFKELIKHFEQKFNVNLNKIIKEFLSVG